MLFMMITYIILPCVIILQFYVRIFIFTYKSRNKSKSSSAVRSIRLAKSLFVSYMLFTVCWLPYGIVVMIDFEDKLPRSIIMFTMTLGHFNSSLNPIFYVIFNSDFRRGCVNLFGKVFCCGASFRNNTISATGNQAASSNNSLVKTQNRTLHNI